LLKPGKLDWKIGSSQLVDIIFKQGMPGVGLDELPQPPRALPTRHGWIYYEVRRNKDNPAWKDVLVSQTLAMRLTERLIVNFEELHGQRKIEVAVDGKRAILQFALFAVPSQAQ
jgi:predicted component of type VI protein secretion system